MAEPRTALTPLRYRLRQLDDMQVLALDPAGAGRIVEVFGAIEVARHIAVVVPGNAHVLADYRHETGGAAPRRVGRALFTTLREVAPNDPCAVVVWLGYRCPRGLLAAARRVAAASGAEDLGRLTRWLPPTASITLIGHSYGSLVCALAAEAGRVDDLIALASPGLGVRHASRLRTGARIWAARNADDWVRLLPSFRVVGFGHGRQPTHPRFGARVFACPGSHGHSGYYTVGSGGLHNIAKIVVGAGPGTAGPDMEVVTTDPDCPASVAPHQAIDLGRGVPASWFVAP